MLDHEPRSSTSPEEFAMSRRTDPTPNSLAPNILPMVPAWPEAFALGESRKAFAVGMKMQAHSMKAALRWQAEAQFLDDLVADEEFKDAFDIVAAYMQNATMDWMDEAGRLAALAPEIAEEAATAIREQAEAAAQDIAATTVAA
jgi:Arc/MetJ-type ribon-helix-helix transcriptional regulator